MSKPKIGVTLFSYAQEYARGEYTLEDTIRISSELGATGIEIVGSQMLPEYPFVSDKFVETFNDLCSRYGVEKVCYGANTDRGMLNDRDLTDDEVFSSTLIDIETAHRLGFKIMRVQYLLSPDAMKRLEPYARAYDVKLGVEIHNPQTPSTKPILEYLKVFKEVNSEYLGFVPDFGSFAIRPNKPHWEQALRDGAALSHLEKARDMRYSGVPLNEAKEALTQLGAHEAVFAALSGMYGFVTFYQEPDLDGLKNIMDYTIHFHGKFHYVSENLQEASIPYPDILEVIYKSDYEGYVVSEYEDQSGASKEMLDRHIRMMHKILGELKGDD